MSEYLTGNKNTMVLPPLRRYNEFAIDPANRNINELSVARLAEGLDSTYLLDLYPIVATTEKVVLDGQHRFTAARDMVLPFYAIIGDDISIADIAEANSNTNKYNEQDALDVYCNIGAASYVYLRDFIERNPGILLSDARSWLNGDLLVNDFIQGSFSVCYPQLAQVVADRVRDFMSVHRWVQRSPAYKKALFNLTINPVYDHERMMNRLKAIPVRLLKCGTEKEALEILNVIYNYQLAKSNRIRLERVAPSQAVNRYDKNSEPILSGLDTPARGIAYQRHVEVHTTSNLGQFNLHPSARSVRGNRLKNLVDFMRRRNLLRYYPILVDSSYTVIDGQLRLLAARELNLPISYIVTNHFSLHMSVSAAARSKTWGKADYLKYFCKSGIEDYLHLERFLSQYPHIGLHHGIRFLSDTSLGFTLMEHYFKVGKFKAVARTRANRLAILLGQVHDERLKRSSVFKNAMFNQIENPLFDAEKFVERLNKYPDLMGPFADVSGCVEQMSNVYNVRVRSEDRVTLQFIDFRDARQRRPLEIGIS